MKIKKLILLALIFGSSQLIGSEGEDIDIEEARKKAFDLPIFKLLNEQKFNEAEKLIESNPSILGQKNSLGETPLTFLIDKTTTGNDSEVKYQKFLISLLSNQNINLKNVINIQAYTNGHEDNSTPLCYAVGMNIYFKPFIRMSSTIQPTITFIEEQLIPKLIEAGADPKVCTEEEQKILKKIQEKQQQEEGRQGRMALERFMSTKQGAALPSELNRRITQYLLPKNPDQPTTQSTSAMPTASTSSTSATSSTPSSTTSRSSNSSTGSTSSISSSGGLEDVE